MNTKLSIFVLCVLAAIGGYAVATLTPRAAAQSGSPTSIQRVKVFGIPTAQQMVRIVEGQPFTVPDNKIFVATGIGSTGVLGTFKEIAVSFNNTRVLTHLPFVTHGHNPASVTVCCRDILESALRRCSRVSRVRS